LTRLRRVGGRPGEARDATARRVAAAATIQLVVRVLNVALGIVTVALLTRALGTDGFGIWSAASAFVAMFLYLTDFGTTQIAVQKMSGEPEREADWIAATLVARAMASSAAFVLCLGAITFGLSDPEARQVAALLAIGVLLAIPGALVVVFQSRLRAEVTMGLVTLESVGWFLGVLVLSGGNASVTEYAAVFVLVAGVAAGFEVLAAVRWATVRLSAGRSLWRELLRVSLPLGVAGVLVTVHHRIGAVLLLNLEGDDEAGLYGAAFRLLEALHILPMAVMSTIFPVLAASYGIDARRTRRFVEVAITSLGILSFPFLAGSVVVGDQLMSTLFGGEFEEAGSVLPVMMIAFVAISFGYLTGYFVSILSIQRFYVLLGGLGVIASVALNLALIPSWGAQGAAWATAGTETMVAVIAYVFVVRNLDFRPSVSRIAGAALACGPLILAAQLALPLGLMSALLAGALAYSAAIVAFRVVRMDDVRIFLAARSG
jgi:PST family polysaccharide transporter